MVARTGIWDKRQIRQGIIAVTIKEVISGLKEAAKKILPEKPVRETTQALIYAIGDVHGRQDLLASLIGKIKQDMSEQNFEHIYLG